MSFKVKFDTVLGRLREKDAQTETPPDPNPLFEVETLPAQDLRYMADEELNPGLTVTVYTRFAGELVDADETPTGWYRTSLGTYTRHIDEPGTIAAQAWSYTPGGIYGEQTATKNSEARRLIAVYPAYWGIYPGNDATGDISAIVADLCQQHRATANVNTTVDIPNPTANSCWLWIVTHNTADAEPTATPGISMMDTPITGKTFGSPLANWNMTGYKAYVSMHSAKAGASFGNIKITINL